VAAVELKKIIIWLADFAIKQNQIKDRSDIREKQKCF
jgi:hypothetical protein